MTPKTNFKSLTTSIKEINHTLVTQASRAVNTSLTLRNWLIGFHIAEFILHGADRADYGDTLLLTLSKELKSLQVSNCGKRQLYNYLTFYRTYPQIVRSVSAQFDNLLPADKRVEEKVPAVSAQLVIPPERLLNNFSYSHFSLLFALDDDLKRAFYEIECLQGNWSVRELKRQIASLYFERSDLSKDKKKLAELAQDGAELSAPNLTIRDPYVFEFLGLKPTEVMGESKLEDALLGKLQDFLLELGHGFCF